MTLDDLIKFVHGYIVDNIPIGSKTSRKGWRTFSCVKCTDKRGRAGVKITGGQISYNCFNCGFKTTWSPESGPYISDKFKELLRVFHVSKFDIGKLELTLLEHKDLLDDATGFTYKPKFQKFKSIKLPDCTLISDLPDGNELKEYAKSRHLLELTPLLRFDNYKGRYEYDKRVVIPFTFDGDLVGWSGRHIHPKINSTPKYHNNFPEGYVYNIDKFINSEREVIIVTEGVLDALKVDGVSILGNSITPEQAALIEGLGKRVIVCPDFDKSGKQLIYEAIALGWEVSFPDWDGPTDADKACEKYGRLLTVSSIINSAIADETEIKVRAGFIE